MLKKVWRLATYGSTARCMMLFRSLRPQCLACLLSFPASSVEKSGHPRSCGKLLRPHQEIDEGGEKYISQVAAATGKILDPLYFQKSSFCQFSTFAKIRIWAQTVNGPGKPDYRVSSPHWSSCIIRELMAQILEASTRN